MGARYGIILLTVILTALQFVLPAVAFAALARVAPNPPSDAAFARAEVSVVRILVIYEPTPSLQLPTTIVPGLGQSPVPSPVSSQVECTGLGILVGSWLATAAKAPDPYVNWVLTDAALVNQTGAVCVPPNTAPVSLASIDVFLNNVYTNSHPFSNTLGTLMCQTATTTACTTAGTSVSSDFLSVNASAILFSFRSAAPQPFVDIATQDLTPDQAIRLTDARGGLPSSLLALNNQAPNFLNPLPVPLNANTLTTSKQNVEEPGTPSVNAAGQLVSIQAGSGPQPVTKADALLKAQSPAPTLRTNLQNLHTNPLRDAWNTGISNFYANPPKYPAAAKEFRMAAAANPAFQAATTFATLSDNGGRAPGQVSPTPGPKRTPVPTSAVSHPSSFFGNPWLLLGIGLLGLIILLVGIGLLLRARAYRKELAPFEADEAQATRAAELEVQRQQRARQTQAATAVVENKASTPPPPSRLMPVSEAPKVLNIPAQPTPQSQQAASVVNAPGTTTHAQTASDLRCPNCGRFVQVGATYCPNCRYQLSSVGYLSPRQGSRFITPADALHAKAGTAGELPRIDERNDAESIGYLSPRQDTLPGGQVSRFIVPAGPGGVPAVPQTQEAPVEATPENASVEARLRRLWSQSE